MKLRFEKIIEANNLEENSFPSELQKLIQEAHKIKAIIVEMEEGAEFDKLQNRLYALDEKISDEIKELTDRETTTTISDQEVKKEILKNLLSSGKNLVSYGELKSKGYPTNKLTGRGEKIDGNYQLSKSRIEKSYKILKM